MSDTHTHKKKKAVGQCFSLLNYSENRSSFTLKESSCNATAMLYASIAACSPASLFYSWQCSSCITSKYKQRASLKNIYLHIGAELFFPLSHCLSDCSFFLLVSSCWCGAILAGCEKLTAICQCINNAWPRDVGVRASALGTTPPRQPKLHFPRRRDRKACQRHKLTESGRYL